MLFFFICIYTYILFVLYYNYYVRFWIYIVNTRVWHVHMYTGTLYNVHCTVHKYNCMHYVYCILYNVYIKSSSTRLPIELRDFKIQSSTANCTWSNYRDTITNLSTYSLSLWRKNYRNHSLRITVLHIVCSKFLLSLYPLFFLKRGLLI